MKIFVLSIFISCAFRLISFKEAIFCELNKSKVFKACISIRFIPIISLFFKRISLVDIRFKSFFANKERLSLTIFCPLKDKFVFDIIFDSLSPTLEKYRFLKASIFTLFADKFKEAKSIFPLDLRLKSLPVWIFKFFADKVSEIISIFLLEDKVAFVKFEIEVFI